MHSEPSRGFLVAMPVASRGRENHKGSRIHMLGARNCNARGESRA